MRVETTAAKHVGTCFKCRLTYILLALFLGPLGVHNFYVDRDNRAIAQLLITILTGGLLLPVTWLWSLLDVFLVTTDGDGIPLQFRVI